jgi:hypothetical protein
MICSCIDSQLVEEIGALPRSDGTVDRKADRRTRFQRERPALRDYPGHAIRALSPRTPHLRFCKARSEIENADRHQKRRHSAAATT